MMAPYQPFWYEEPVSARNIDALAACRRDIRLPIVTGEELYTLGGMFRAALPDFRIQLVGTDMNPAALIAARLGRYSKRSLRGIEGKLIGPGHNSVVLGPDGRTHFVVYHAWDPARTARRMCIDPLVFTADGPRCLGPTIERQPMNLA